MQWIASGYGRAQPDTALAWAQNLQPPQPEVVRAVISGIAQTDPVRALDLALENRRPAAYGPATGDLMLVLNQMRDDTQAQAMASRVLTIETTQERQQALQMLLSAWAQRSPDAAVTWLAANGNAVAPADYGQIARQLAMRDPAAAATIDSIPSAARADWIAVFTLP